MTDISQVLIDHDEWQRQAVVAQNAEFRDKAKIVRFARALERAASALTGRPMKVRVTRLDASDSNNESFEQVDSSGKMNIGVALPMSVAADSQPFIRVVLGLYYHALTHVWFTPRSKNVRSALLYNLLEDQRIESFAVALYPALANYFRAAFAHMVAHGGVEPDTAYLLASGRKFLDPDIVSAARKVFKFRDQADEIDAVIASYKRLHTADMTLQEINDHIGRLWPLINWDNYPPQISKHFGEAEGSGDAKSHRQMVDEAIQLIEEEDADSFDQTGGVPKPDSDLDPNGEGDGAEGGSAKGEQSSGSDDSDDDDSDDSVPADHDRDKTHRAPEESFGDDPDDTDTDDWDGTGREGPGQDPAEIDSAESDGRGGSDGTDDESEAAETKSEGVSGASTSGKGGRDTGDPDDAAENDTGRSQGTGVSRDGGHHADNSISDEDMDDLLAALVDAAQESYDAESNDDLVNEDTRTFQGAMQGNARIDVDELPGLPASADMELAATLFAGKMAQFMTPDVDPGWERHQPTGRLNAGRYVMGDIEDYDTMFDVWEPGHTEAFQVSAAVMVDRSPSMGSVNTPNSMMNQACRASWVIRRGLEMQDCAVRTMFWCSEEDFVYVYGDDKVGRDYRLVHTDGGTSPAPALADMESWLDSRPDNENRILFILTDGKWGDYMFSAPIIDAMRERGIVVVLIGFGILPDEGKGFGVHADVTARVDSGDDFVLLAGDVMEALYRKITMTLERR